MDPTLAALWGGIMQNQAPAPTAYPTFPNAGGFGTQMGYQGAQPQKSQSNEPQPDASSTRSFNPWSLRGEALSRGEA